jgi:sugar lactone lactonase YvrE
MKRITIIGGIITAMAMMSSPVFAGVDHRLAEGEAVVLYDFIDPVDALASPEGIIFDRMGNMYISLRTKSGTDYIGNEILKIDKKGEVSVLADFGALGGGIRGLASDPKGNVYVAVPSEDSMHGIWKVYPDGSKERLAGSHQIIEPNALIFDKQGNLYATDSSAVGSSDPAVWRYGKKEQVFEPWASHPLLKINPGSPAGVGANGIAFVPPNNLYVANTSEDRLVHITVLKDGSAGDVSVVAAGWPMFSPDGLAVDASGNVYTVSPMSTFPTWFGLPPLTPVMRIVPSTGEIQPVVPLGDWTLPDNPHGDYFDMPSSLAFGTGSWDHKSLYVVGIQMASFGLPPGTGAKLTQVGVGIPGRK